jgi:hypothetical protein
LNQSSKYPLSFVQQQNCSFINRWTFILRNFALINIDFGDFAHFSARLNQILICPLLLQSCSAGSGIRTHAAPRGHKLLGVLRASPGLLPTWLGDPGTKRLIMLCVFIIVFQFELSLCAALTTVFLLSARGSRFFSREPCSYQKFR